MKRKSPRQMEDDRRLAERAAEWVTLLPDAAPEERAEFVAWVKESPRHMQEFLLASAVVRGLEGVDLEKLAARELETAPNVVHLAQVPPAVDSQPGLRRTPWMRWHWAAVAAAGALVVSGFLWLTGPKTYATDVGEQRTVHLDDGSVIQLNTRSRVQILLTARARDVRLLDGEAMFKVEHDASRPFTVRTATSVIQVLGTQFNVLRRPSGTTVSVIEGKVQIAAERVLPHSSSHAKLEAGEEARIGTDGRIEQRTTIDVVRAAAWRRNRLDFRADKLIDIAAMFNRYNEAPQIVVDDGVASERRYSGVFDAGDPRSLAEFLRDDVRLAVEERGSAIVIRSRE